MLDAGGGLFSVRRTDASYVGMVCPQGICMRMSIMARQRGRQHCDHLYTWLITTSFCQHLYRCVVVTSLDDPTRQDQRPTAAMIIWDCWFAVATGHILISKKDCHDYV